MLGAVSLPIKWLRHSKQPCKSGGQQGGFGKRGSCLAAENSVFAENGENLGITNGGVPRGGAFHNSCRARHNPEPRSEV